MSFDLMWRLLYEVTILNSSSIVYMLLVDCLRYGTRPHAGK
jgi:hypothetical protein